ncbi:MAG: hypothetical protein KDE30_02830, partial [Novosphingobium sp.]|nr:hypothetical protein [Novosphingobium sp.]
MSAPAKHVQTTIRLPGRLHAQLSQLSEMLGKPVSKLMLEGLQSYLVQKLIEVESDARDLAEAARALREADGDYLGRVEADAAAEAAIADDPVEGRIVRGRVR